MADESPVIRQKPSQQTLKHFNSNPQSIADHPPDNNMISDEELSVGGTTPPPPDRADDSLSVESDSFRDEQDTNGLDGDKDSVGSATLIKFSIDNILKKNSEFGRMNAAESAVAAVALHHHHKQLIQQQQQQPVNETSPSDSGFLGAFHQLPFLAAARQMILAATTAGNSQIDYHHQHNLAAHLAQYPSVHPLSSLMLGQNQHQTNSLNLVQSCTDKYLTGNNFKGSNWPPHQPAPPSGSSKSVHHAVNSAGSNTRAKVAKNSHHQQTNSKAIDLTVRNSSSPPDHRGRTVSDDKKLMVSQLSPMLASSNSTDENASASPTRSVSVGGSTSSVGNGEFGSAAGVSSSGSQQHQNASAGSGGEGSNSKEPLWPAWVYCTRYSDRPSSGPRARRIRTKKDRKAEEKRPRTAFTSEQLARLKTEFTENRYLTEKRRQDLARELQLHENQIKIWFQNKRAKIKKASGQKNPLALQLMAQGLYNHSTMALDDEDDDEDDDDDMMNPDFDNKSISK